MADIPITSRRGVQGVALVFACGLALQAFLLATTGWGTPFPGCWPRLPQPYALTGSAVQGALAVGFAVAALRNPAGPALNDRLLISLVLALFASIALRSGVYAFDTGVARFGRSGCVDVGAPWSYGAAAVSVFVGGIALFAAAMVAVGRGESD